MSRGFVRRLCCSITRLCSSAACLRFVLLGLSESGLSCYMIGPATNKRARYRTVPLGDIDTTNLYKGIPFLYFDPFHSFNLVFKAMAAGESGRHSEILHLAPIPPTTEVVKATQVEGFTAMQMEKTLRRSR